MKNYSIFVLGPSGSGKTTFFASLFYKRSHVEGKNFFLKTKNIETEKHLVDLYAKLAKGDWPKGTRKISQWVFDCRVQNFDQTQTSACDLTLFDYKGGVITDQIESEDKDDVAEAIQDEKDFTQAIEKAAAVLAILDGQKVLAFMQDKDLMDTKVSDWMHKELIGILQAIQNLDSGEFSLHFLISKWDVLENANYSLNEIKQKLFEKVPKFEALVKQRDDAGKPFYLIPISAVGKGFASLKNGIMEKNLGTIPLPFGVEVPLALALTDLHKDIVSKPSAQAPVKQHTDSRLNPIGYFLVGLALIVFLNILGLLIVGVYILFRLLKGSQNKNSRSNNSKPTAQASSSDDAFRQLLDECRQIRESFLHEFPAATCTEIKQGVKV